MIEFINQIAPFAIFWSPILYVAIRHEKRLTRIETKMDIYFNGNLNKKGEEDV